MVLKSEDLVEGYKASFHFIFDQEAVSKYVDIIGDRNPIHTDSEFARGKGLEKTIVPGNLIVGKVVGLASSEFPFGAMLVEESFRFKHPLYVGYPVEMSFCIDEVTGEPTRKIIKISTIAAHNGTVYAEGNIKAFFSQR